jgi:hypothetical protein
VSGGINKNIGCLQAASLCFCRQAIGNTHHSGINLSACVLSINIPCTLDVPC